MKQRAVLTVLWLGAFLVCIGLVELYLSRRDAAGLLALLPEDRVPALKPLASLYGAYLAGILAFWFTKPFKAPRKDARRRFQFALALACTLIFNGIVVYLVARGHLWREGNVIDDILTATKLAALLSFIVGPVNLYYFGATRT
jgi:hypothetical protein